MTRMDWLLLAFNTSLGLLLVRWLFHKRADAVADVKPRCKHGTVRPLQCTYCDDEAKAYFNEQGRPFDPNARQIMPVCDSTYETVPPPSKPRALFNQGSPLWTTKDGRQITVDQMSTSHLTNSIALLERRYAALLKNNGRVYELCAAIQRVSPEQCRGHAEQMGPSLAWPIYTALTQELDRRIVAQVIPRCATCEACQKQGGRCDECARFGCKECY